MKILSNFNKTFKENIREWKILIMVIVFAPFFVYLMYAYYGDSIVLTYDVALLNLDKKGVYTKELVNEWENIKSEDGERILNILPVSDSGTAGKMIRDGTADLFITIPDGFSYSLDYYLKTGKGLSVSLVNYGDQSNVKFMMAASFMDYTTFNYAIMRLGIKMPIDIKFESDDIRRGLRDFDIYVPALLILSIIMILFTKTPPTTIV